MWLTMLADNASMSMDQEVSAHALVIMNIERGVQNLPWLRPAIVCCVLDLEKYLGGSN